MPVTLRASRASDHAYLAKTLARCLGETGLARGADWPAWHDEVDRLLKAWVAEGARILVAALEADDDAIVGFCIGKPPALHYVYVRGGEAGVRGTGVARLMLEALGTFASYSLPPQNKTSLTKRLAYAPRLTVGFAC